MKEENNIKIGSEVGVDVQCSNCNKTGTTDTFITLQGKNGQDVYLCKECKHELNSHFKKETENVKLFRGFLGGALGGLIGGTVWYWIAVFTKMEIGYVALGMGYLIGYGVYFASGKKRGHKLQVMSALIAVVSIIITEKFLFDYFANDYISKHRSEINLPEGFNGMSVSLLSPDFWLNMVSPIGLLIYAICVYIAYKFCKPTKI